jgi:hypothetical protein
MGLLGEDPSERLFALTGRHPIDFAGIASGDPMGTVRGACATVDLDGVTSGRFGWVAIPGDCILIIITVATAGRNEVVRMTDRPRCNAGALDYFCKCLPLRLGRCRKELREIAHGVNLYLRKADRAIRLHSILNRLRA